jgi:hypothetical protein
MKSSALVDPSLIFADVAKSGVTEKLHTGRPKSLQTRLEPTRVEPLTLPANFEAQAEVTDSDKHTSLLRNRIH